MAEADQAGLLKRAWRWLGEFAEAMDITEASYTSDRVSRLERQVRELQARIPEALGREATPAATNANGGAGRDAVQRS